MLSFIFFHLYESALMFCYCLSESDTIKESHDQATCLRSTCNDFSEEAEATGHG